MTALALAMAAIAVRAEAEQTRPAAVTEADGTIAAEIERRLGYAPSVNASAMTVVVHDGIVTLKGRVVSEAAKKRAETAAAEVLGVTHVQNELLVGAAARGRPGGPGSIPEAVPGSE